MVEQWIAAVGRIMEAIVQRHKGNVKPEELCLTSPVILS